MQIEKVNKTDMLFIVNATGANTVFKDIKVTMCSGKVQSATGLMFSLDEKSLGGFSYTTSSTVGGTGINLSIPFSSLITVSEDIISFINAIEADTNIINL